MTTLKMFIKELFFGWIPFIVFIAFTDNLIFNNSYFGLGFYYKWCAISVALVSLESMLFQNGIIKNTTSHIIKKFNTNISFYLCLLFYLSFILMSILNYWGLDNYRIKFYVLTAIFGLSFLSIRYIESYYEKKHKISEINNLKTQI
jgi:hypothetical protein